MVGPLAHLLKNRFYIGEVAYRGEIHPGEQPPIVDTGLFEAVQTRLKDKAVTRRITRSKSLAFLMGLLYDDRGHRMSPSHANKKGVRYRYYVSQVVLQNRKDDAGSISRIAAPEIEDLVVAAVRHQASKLDPPNTADQSLSTAPQLSDRDVVALHVERIVLRAKHIDISLRARALELQQEDADALDGEGLGALDQNDPAPGMLQLPWTPTSSGARKGIAWKPSAKSNLDPESIETLLTAIAKARVWMNDITEGRVASFDDIALAESKVERHVRFLAPLAFVSPRIIEAIAKGSAPGDLTVSALARALPHRWADQEIKFGIA
jgi:site-specific DNA recombinase